MTEAIHPIESESYRILGQRIDLSDRTPGVAAVVARIVHASADTEFADTTVVDEPAVSAGVVALRSGAPIICDVEMVRAGITGADALCLLSEVSAGPGGTPTRSANAVNLAAQRFPNGAVFVIGCAPTALFEVLRLVDLGELRPSLVIGLPVGFVGASESKEALRRMSSMSPHGRPLHSISNIGEKGGSSVAAAACNAMLRLAGASPVPQSPWTETSIGSGSDRA
jgi:precorrin-8X/cobalt-precorrin-8 methylmutase